VLKILVGVFLIVHGLIHVTYFVRSNDPHYAMTAARSWLVTRAGLRPEVVRSLVAVLAVVATLGFFLVALSYWGLIVPVGWFAPLAIGSAAVSLVLIAATWSVQLVVGAAINVGIFIWALR
jgi:hypothetical protein